MRVKRTRKESTLAIALLSNSRRNFLIGLLKINYESESNEIFLFAIKKRSKILIVHDGTSFSKLSSESDKYWIDT